MLDRYDQDLLLDYLEGELADDRRAELEAMLADDPQLAQLLEAMSRDRAALRSLPPAELPGDLAQDVTQSLERRMLLDEDAVDVGPIPIARGRALPNEPTGGPRWGRIAGLSALAASVAVAAGVVVIMGGQDPLTETAERLADSTGNEAEDAEDAWAGAGTDESARPEGATPDPAEAGTAGDTLPGAPTRDAVRPVDLAEGSTGRGTPVEGFTPDPEALARTDNADERDTAPGRAAVDHVLRPQPPVALAVTEPDRQLVLFSEKPELTQEQLVAYCVGNGIPIVQTNVALNSIDNGFDAGSAPDDADADTFERLALDNNLALLVDQEKLDDLVLTLNNDITLDREDLSRGAFFSNQAAVVTELPLDQSRQRRAAQNPNDTAEAEADLAASSDASADLLTQQRSPGNQAPIELQLPEDLGSEYANTRNRTNLYVEQRRNQLQFNQIADPPQPATEPGGPPNTDAAHEVGDSAGIDDPQAPLTDPSQPGAVRPAEHAGEPGDPEPGDDRPAEDAVPSDKPERVPLDPARGNWLAPHLPLANTTPILTWRHTPADPPAQLVPVLIQRAPTDRVNALRVEQQAEQSKRAERAETEQPGADELRAEEAPPESDEQAGETQPAE